MLTINETPDNEKAARGRPRTTITAPIIGSPADKRVYWRSRRGMAELEQQLLPFCVEAYPGLSDAEKAVYARLIEFEDWEIFDWLQGKEVAPDAQLRALVDQLLAYQRE